MKNVKKLFALILCAAMVLALLPVLGQSAPAAQAAEEEPSVEGLYATKMVSTVKDDGTYDITMETYVTGKVTTVTTSTPLDIVLVLDVSGSMAYSMNGLVTYKAQTSRSYTYRSIANANYYYKDGDNYYPLSRGGSCSSGTYIAYEKNGTTYYLSGSGSTTTRPTGRDRGDTQYTGVLYTSSTGTKMDALRTAVASFLNVVYADASKNNVDHKVSIVKFASGYPSGRATIEEGNTMSGSYNQTRVVKGLTSVKDGSAINAALTATVSDPSSDNYLQTGGATSADYGMTLARMELEAHGRPDAQKVVVMFTDGEPNHDSDFDSTVANDTVKASNTMKNPNGINATVYTVGVFSGITNTTNIYHYMDAVSSNIGYKANQASAVYTASTATAPTGKFMTAGSQAELETIFGNIASEVTGSATCNLTTTSSVLDGITNFFELPAGFDITDTDDIEVTYAEQASTTPTFGAAQSFASGSEPTIIYKAADKTIRVTNFDYSKYFVADNLDADGKNTNGVKGRKLIITIHGITPSGAALAAALASATDPCSLPTNTAGENGTVVSGVYQDEELQQQLKGFASPSAKIKKGTEKVFVIDYAKTVDVTPDGELKGAALKAEDINVKAGIQSSYTGKNGTFTYNSTSKKMSYAPNTTVWDGEDNIYAAALVDYTDPDTSVTAKVYGVQKVTVKAANNVYYEDDFVAGEDGAGIVYTGTWTATGTGSNAGGVNTAADTVDGWVESLADDATYSDGTVHTASAEGASAAISFKGTGIDVYTRTTSDSGTVFAVLRKNDTNKTFVKCLFMDNKSVSAENGYYQVPTLSIMDLEDGEYVLTINVTNVSDSRLTYYIDGFRVYNPAENGAKFITISDMEGLTGSVFVDEQKAAAEGETGASGVVSISDAGDYMAENEIYLKGDATVTFNLSGGKAYYIGMKSLTGDEVKASFSKGAASAKTASIKHTTDMYYEVTPDGSGNVTVKNAGGGILALTKIQVIPAATLSSVSAAVVGGEEGLKAAKTFAVLCAMTEPEEAEAPVEVLEEPADAEPEIIVEQPEVKEVDEAQQVIKLVKSIIGSFRKLLKH